MLKKKIVTTLLAVLLPAVGLFSQQEDKKPDPAELAEKEVERLETALSLEDWQVFYVDSILVYNYTELFKEMDALQRAHVTNTDIYYNIQDKWMERTEEAYQKVFTEEQWNTYLKQGGARIIKERAKRREKAAAPTLKDKKKK